MAEEQRLLLPGSIAGTATMSSIFRTKLTELIACRNGKTEKKISWKNCVVCCWGKGVMLVAEMSPSLGSHGQVTAVPGTCSATDGSGTHKAEATRTL